MTENIVGREIEARLITIALITKEHVAFIGEPGISKSELARNAATLINANVFVTTVTPDTRPEEILGHLDIPSLRRGRYKHITKRRLPEAEIALLDEVFNANSLVLKALLTLINERIIDTGYASYPAPLRTLICASNQGPSDKELMSFYDRILLRYFPDAVPKYLWGDLLRVTWEKEFSRKKKKEPIITISDLDKLYGMLESVDVSKVSDRLISLFEVFERQKLHMVDRRKGKILKIVAANALLNGRMEAREEDLMVLSYMSLNSKEAFEYVTKTLAAELQVPSWYMREITNVSKSISFSLLRAGKGLLTPSDVDFLKKDLETAKNRVNDMKLKCENEEVNACARRVINAIEIISSSPDGLTQECINKASAALTEQNKEHEDVA